MPLGFLRVDLMKVSRANVPTMVTVTTVRTCVIQMATNFQPSAKSRPKPLSHWPKILILGPKSKNTALKTVPAAISPRDLPEGLAPKTASA